MRISSLIERDFKFEKEKIEKGEKKSITFKIYKFNKLKI